MGCEWSKIQKTVLFLRVFFYIWSSHLFSSDLNEDVHNWSGRRKPSIINSHYSSIEFQKLHISVKVQALYTFKHDAPDEDSAFQLPCDII